MVYAVCIRVDACAYACLFVCVCLLVCMCARVCMCEWEREPTEVVPHLQYLGSFVQNDCGLDNCLPKQLLVLAPVGGKHATGGQKRRWNDVESKGFRLCSLLTTWKEEAEERDSWCATIKHSVAFLKKPAEVNEKSRKVELK